MARREQDALLALFNSFRPSRRVTAFEQLADGKVLMEVCELDPDWTCGGWLTV